MIDQYEYTSQLAEDGATLDYGELLAHVPAAWRVTRGEGVRVGVIDTGRPQHFNLQEAVVASWPLIGRYDPVGHGTHVAGIIGARDIGKGIIGVAPKCSLYCAKSVPGDWGRVKRALDWCVAMKVDVVSMSFGSGDAPPPDVCDSFKRASDKGVFMCAAAGNTRVDGQDTIGYPAKLPEVVPVAAIGPGATDAPFSASGSELERGFAMPGVDVLSTWLDNGYARLSGTSMACPFVAGMAALVIAHNRQNGAHWLEPQTVLGNLEAMAVSIGDPLKFGHGYLDASKL